MIQIALKSFKKLKSEINKIKILYVVSMYTYFETKGRLNGELKNGKINGSTVLTFDKVKLASSPYEMIDKLDSRYPKMIRESLFVRLVSVLEVYFGDVLRELAVRTIDPFKTQSEKTYHISQLLSFRNINEVYIDVIEDQIRNVVSGGFKSINKYYRRQLEIDLSQTDQIFRKLEEIYERRHLFVHAAGRVDEKYQRNFAPDLLRGEVLDIGEDYFNEALVVVQNMAEFVSMKIEEKWPEAKTTKFSLHDVNYERQGERRYRFHAVFKFNGDMKTFLSEDYNYGFKNQEKKYPFKDILEERTIISNVEAKWIVAGDKESTGVYRGIVRYMERKGYFIYLGFEDLSIKNRREKL